MKVQLLASGVGLAGEELEGLQSRARNAKPAMAVVMRRLVEAEREQFESSGARGGKRWPEDTEEWQDRKRAAGKPTEPERYTGLLMASLADEKHPQGIRTIGKQRAAIGTKVFYGLFQQKKRPLFGPGARDITPIQDIVVGWLLDGTARA